MIHAFSILLLSCVTLCAAAPIFYAPTTNQLKAIVIPPLSVRMAAFSSGSAVTNGFDGGFWLFDAASAWAANGTNIIAPTTGTGKWHISNSILRRYNFDTNVFDYLLRSTIVGQSNPMFSLSVGGILRWSPGSGVEDTVLSRTASGVLKTDGLFHSANGFLVGASNPINYFIKNNGSAYVGADLFDTENTWTDRQVFSQGLVSDPGISMLVNGDSNKRFDIFMDGQLNWGSGSAVTDAVLYRSAVGTLVVNTNLAVSGLTAGRVVAATTSGLLVSLSAPAVDGYVLSSTIAGVQSWILNGSGGVSGANPTASVGLSAVNGSATTYLRSDGAPALSQSIVPTWSGQHVFSVDPYVSNASNPGYRIYDSGGSSNSRRYWLQADSASGNTFSIQAVLDDNSTAAPIFKISRSGTDATTTTLYGGINTAGLTGPGLLGIDSSENVTVSAVATLAAGTYTPTLSNVANLDGSTAFVCQYSRVGSVVTVSGKVSVNPTLTVTSTQLGISLPVASGLTAQEQVGGTAYASGIAAQGAAIRGDATNDRAEMVWMATDTTDQPMYFTFTYLIQ